MPTSSLLAGGLLGLVGFFVIPVVGLVIGFVGGVWAPNGCGWAATSSPGRPPCRRSKAAGLSMLVEFLAGLVIAALWVAGLLLSDLRPAGGRERPRRRANRSALGGAGAATQANRLRDREVLVRAVLGGAGGGGGAAGGFGGGAAWAGRPVVVRRTQGCPERYDAGSPRHGEPDERGVGSPARRGAASRARASAELARR